MPCLDCRTETRPRKRHAPCDLTTCPAWPGRRDVHAHRAGAGTPRHDNRSPGHQRPPGDDFGGAGRAAVYAIGNPKGLDLTLSAGLVSSLRRNPTGQLVLIQTSAAISGGSSGGGLFDDSGRLIGLTTIGSVGADTQNLNFAVPSEWIAELPQRHALRLAAAKPASAAAPGTPTPPPSPSYRQATDQ